MPDWFYPIYTVIFVVVNLVAFVVAPAHKWFMRLWGALWISLIVLAIIHPGKPRPQSEWFVPGECETYSDCLHD
jgi:hypothetical protein